jgi:Ca2+-binding RTX toxin-like protein
MYVSSGGMANNTTVNSGGNFYVSNGGTARGRLQFEGGAIVSMFAGAVLDFDLTRVEAGGKALVNDLSIIQGAPVYTLTVDGDLKPRSYVYALAEGASEFNRTISVVNALGDELGTLTVGETVRIGGDDYTLNLNEGALSVTIVPDVTPPVITLSADTETVVLQTTLTATVDDGSKIHYRIGEFGAWKEYKEPIIASLNETYYFMAADEAGNIGTNEITFANIDTSGVLLSTLWTQKGICPMGGNTTILYNEYTPLDPSVTPDAHCLTGCVNTASGQLIYYFIEKGWLDLPLTLKKSDEYTSKHKATEEDGEKIVIEIKADGTTPGTLSFAEINAMLSDFQLDSAEHAAALLYAIGVVLESKYSASSTGTSWNRVFFKRTGFEGETMGGPYFGEYYWGDMDDEMQYTITDAGFEVLIENLEAGLPVGATYPGHAFVIDGYDRESDTFHINLGWGGNQATRWYTRDEMQEELNCEYFVYDLNPEYVETFTVTDARVYGTGTMIRAFEQAAGMIGDNTVAFDPSVAGKTVELLNHITFFDEVISVKDFNMNVLVTESQGGENSYGFYADHIDMFEPTDPETVLTFHSTGGSLIVSTENEFNYAFQMEDGLSCTIDADGMLIWAGKTSEGTEAAAVLQALQTCRSEKTEVSGDLLDPNGWSYNGSAGEDVFRLTNSSLAVGNVSLGTGDDVLSLTDHSRLYGNIAAGDGSDSITVDSTSSVSGDLVGKSKLNFVLAERNDHAMFTIKSSVSDLCAYATVTVDMTNAEIGTYTLISAESGAAGIADLQKCAVTVTGSGEADFTLSVNGTATGDYADLIFEDNSLKLQVKFESGAIVMPQTQTWENVEAATQYIVEYSTDNFEHAIRLEVDSTSLDSFRMPEGDYRMRVRADGDEWTELEPVSAKATDDKPKLVKSNADGNADAFFLNAASTWESLYAARHTGSMNDTWGGTGEHAALAGKNKLTDIFEGSTDANTLLMTDDANGDALFVDDIYSASPGKLGLSQSRIAQIDEIRAGAGDDIVDMTSNQFEYTGDGMTIRGGDGNDTIWANKGDNFLFGDAGNDRIVGASGNDVIVGGIGNDCMHGGGGGNDVFTFCDNWGTDTVEQLADGAVTLWFTSGDESHWNAETLTYTDGDNSVTVKGVTSVELKFGDDGSDKYDKLLSCGAFAESTSQKIFEEPGKGILASL